MVLYILNAFLFLTCHTHFARLTTNNEHIRRKKMSAGNIFRAYNIRGIMDKDFNAGWVTHLGKTCGTYLVGKGISSAIIGYDCHRSSPACHGVLVEDILSTGTDVISISMVPTPALYFAVKHLNRQGGVMITAGHNPPEYNRFKVWAGQPIIHGGEIQKIKAIFREGAFAEGTGTVSRIGIIPTYKQNTLSRFKPTRPVRVMLDGGNGANGEICVDILTKLGATVVPMLYGPDSDLPNHHSDLVVEANMQAFVACVKEEEADLGIGLDGDADHLDIVDPDGRLLFSDEVLSLYARELLTHKPDSMVIADVKCSSRLFNNIKAHGDTPMIWTTGHSIIKTKMQEVDAPLAGETSGHMSFDGNWYGFDDTAYGSARLVALFSAQDEPMTELPGWPASLATHEVNIPCSDNAKFTVVEKVEAHFRALYDTIEPDGIRVNFPHSWGLVHASNTQPVLITRFEADSTEALAAVREEIGTPPKKWIEETE